ncbi:MULTISPECIES: SCO family protein [unclassified Caulobacter]|uniref:SCO family protein n=1 Tax=unclassified Caulobacter TaxID=2648921 RepID=UPI0006F9F060|nr:MULTISPECIES: SCO family protein [unclassified Caulobacter]KQV55344.1 photosynthetic protein synthase I [Caulobacter sp. Root342]KQV63744.1 photosynthetic protein synthase I [Caulobacter sp. Root343]
MPRHRLVLILACVVGLAVTAGLAWNAGVFKSQPTAAVGGPFQLVDQNGAPATEKVLKGKWSAVFFGFTYCPDVCPGTLQGLAAATDQLGPKAKDFQIVFISIDPGRDTAAQMKTYLSADYVPKSTIGLTGTPEQVAAAAKAYKVYYAKVGDGPGYTMDHSTAIYLMDPKGRFKTVIPYNLPPDEIARRVKDAMREG